MRKTTLILAFALGLFLTASSADASLVLVINDGVNQEVIIDDSAVGTLSSSGAWTSTMLDGGAGAGFVVFNGSIGSWIVNVTTGVSKPLIGPRKIDLASINVSGAAGTLSVALIDTDFTAPLGSSTHNLKTLIGGTTNGTVLSQTGISAANSEAGFTGPLNQETFTGGAFSATNSTPVTLASGSTFSLLAVVTITHTDAGQITSLDQEVSVPEPASALLLLFGAAGLIARRRRKSA